MLDDGFYLSIIIFHLSSIPKFAHSSVNCVIAIFEQEFQKSANNAMRRVATFYFP
jgi:hypothetical protein